MAMQTQEKTGSEQSSDLEQKVQKLRELYADTSEIGKTALENVIRALFTLRNSREFSRMLAATKNLGIGPGWPPRGMTS